MVTGMKMGVLWNVALCSLVDIGMFQRILLPPSSG
jgi:hypothetical protein